MVLGLSFARTGWRASASSYLLLSDWFLDRRRAGSVWMSIFHSIHRRHKMLFFSCYFVFVGGSQFALVLLNLQQPKFLVQPSDLILKATVFGKYTLILEMGPQGGALVS